MRGIVHEPTGPGEGAIPPTETAPGRARRRLVGSAAVTTRDGDAAPRTAALEDAARRLVDAAASHTPCAPVRELVPDGTIDDGYAIQQLVLGATKAGARRVGRKIGLTSAAVQRQMGVDTPDFGVLYADMAYGDDQPVPTDRLLQPRVEAEVAFVLREGLPQRPVVASDVLRATDFVVAAIEIVDSRIAGWDITILDTVADNASSGLFVLGGAPRRLDAIDDLRAAEMTLTHGDEVVSAGTGAACLGHPVNAVVWLANAVAERGVPLEAGEVILSGSLGPLVAVEPGATYEATITGLGSVRATFTA
jgi:2-keto-4-pentenoate hydratase